MSKKNEDLVKIINVTEISEGEVREEKFEDDELKYIDPIEFRKATEKERINLVLQASSNIPDNAPDNALSKATNQIFYLANQINETIRVKILYNNLMVKIAEVVIQNKELLELNTKLNEEMKKGKNLSLEMQLENSNLGGEMKKTNTEKKKPNTKGDKPLRHAFIHGNYYFNLPININNLLINKLIKLFINFIFSC